MYPVGLGDGGWEKEDSPRHEGECSFQQELSVGESPPKEIRLQLIGPPFLQTAQGKIYLSRPDKPFLLLIILAATSGTLTRDAICDILWPDTPKNQAKASLSTALSELSKRIGIAGFPGKTRQTLFWNLPSAAVDLRSILYPEKSGDASHAPHGDGDTSHEEHVKRLEILSRPFLEGALLPEIPSFREWTQAMQSMLDRKRLNLLPVLFQGSPGTSLLGKEESPVERRPLTVLYLRFSFDVKLSDDEILERVEPVRQSVEEAVRFHGGTLVPSPPDALIAYYGYPRSREEDPRHAAHCAREILALTKKMSGLSFSIGLHSGMTSCDRRRGIPDPGGRLSWIAREATMSAPPRIIVLPESSSDFWKKHFRLVPLSKGKGGPLVCLTEELETPGSREKNSGKIVGRESELDLLRRYWKDTCRGMRKTVWIEGEAGIGKSALISEFVREVSDSSDAHVLWEYFCLPEHQGTPWSPIVRFLRKHIALDEPGLSGEERAYRMERYLLEMGRSVSDDFPILRHLLKEQEMLSEALRLLSPDKLGDTIEHFLLSILSGLTRTAPLLLVLEDVHWADHATLSLVEKSLEKLGALPIMMILSCREKRSLETLSLPSPDVALSLAPLDRAEGRLMVSQTSGRNIPLADLRRILDLGQGIPLYLRELAFLVRDEALPVPPTLGALLTSRIDALPKHLRQLLRPAAALGLVFNHETLRIFAPSPEHLDEDLADLCREGLLDRKDDDPPRYAFHHALLREAVLSSLSLPALRSLHGRIADGLSVVHPNIPPEDLAFQLTRAERFSEAVPALRKAASLAAGNGAYADALAHIESALSIVRSHPEQFAGKDELALLLDAGPLAVSLRGHGSETVAAIYDRASELARKAPGTSLPFPVLFGLWTSSFTRIGPAAARPIGEELLSSARTEGSQEYCLRAAYALGGTCFWTGELEYAQTQLRHALEWSRNMNGEIAREGMDSYAEDPEMGARVYLSWLTAIAGDPEEGLREAERGIRRAEVLEHPNSIGYALAFDCYLKMLLEDPENAVAVARRTRDLAEKYGYLQWEVVGKIALAYVSGRKKDLPLSRGAVKAIGEIVPGLSPIFTLIEAMTAMRAGEPELAILSSQRGLEESLQTGARVFDPELFRIQGECLLATGGDPESAAALFRQAIGRAETDGSVLFGMRSAVALARISSREIAPLRDFLGRLRSGKGRTEIRRAQECLDAVVREGRRSKRSG